jgi:hypothetical protein
MSADFEKVLVKDPRLDVSDSIKYAVIKGGQNVTMAQYNAISETNNQLVFNIQVPSEQTIIDRRVLLQTDLTLTVTNTALDASRGCYYGIYSALASFPLHQLMTVMSATINNNTVSVNIRDVLPFIVRLLDCDDLVVYNSSSPTFADPYSSYSPVVVGQGPSNPNGSYWAADETSKVHRGGFAPSSYTFTTPNETFTWQLTEPLLLSPFFFSNLKSNNQGFYGIQNLNIVLNVGNPKRVFRGLVNNGTTYASSQSCPSPALSWLGSGGVINGISAVNAGTTSDGNGSYFKNTRLLFNFITPHPSDLLPARNIVPFYELPRYITPQSITADACPIGMGNGLGGQASAKTFAVKSNSLQLNQIPDKLLLFVRRTAQQQSYGDADFAWPINKIVVNFNNNSGILASAQQVDLWQMSRNNNSHATWNDWKGFGVTNSPSVSDGTITYPPNYATSEMVVPTFGSYLTLEFGKDIQLTEDFYAAGSLGNFNIQIEMTCVNNQPYALSGDNNLELVLITMNSGVFVCERGTSSTYTGILTKQDVLEASQQEHYTHDDVGRMVGGGFFDSLKSGFSKLASKGMEHGKKLAMKHGKKLLEKGAHHLMKKGHKALKKYMPPEEEEEEEE